jgi:hypothetical protein
LYFPFLCPQRMTILCAGVNVTLIWRNWGQFGNYWHRLYA